MKRIGIVIAAVAAIAVVPGVANSAPAKDQVMAHGIQTLVPGSSNHFSINAHSGAAGENPKGNGFYHDNTTKDGTAKGIRFQGPVTCLNVQGNQAAVVIDFRNTKNNSLDWAIVYLEDNGNPAGQASTDRISNVTGVGEPPTTCDPEEPARELTSGDIEIRDAS